jgi:CRP/FNR family transcriptional regulator, cyclic AMP receptor protein
MQDEFDFTKPYAVFNPDSYTPFKPAASKFYDPDVAAQLFETSGKAEHFAAGDTLFVENDKSGRLGLFGKRVVHRMYLVKTGEVTLSLSGKHLDTIKAGEIFGEMAVIGETAAGSTRSATAMAKSDCTALSLNADELQAALLRTPEFALMIMSVMFDRLRIVAARLGARKTTPTKDSAREAAVFDGAALAGLEQKLDRATTTHYAAHKTIMNQGDTGSSMYILLDGRVGIFINGKAVETVATGGMFGEMALVDHSPRTASAVAETDCALLAINRDTLIALVKSEPAVGMTMLRSVAARLRHMNALLS